MVAIEEPPERSKQLINWEKDKKAKTLDKFFNYCYN